MILDKTVLMGIGIVIGIYLLYKFLMSNKTVESKTMESKSDFEKDYNKILNSEEYKVKGQYEK